MRGHKKRWRRLIALCFIVLMGIGIYLFQSKKMERDNEKVVCLEVENEIEAAVGVQLDLKGYYFTYSQLEEVLEQIHLQDYITYKTEYGMKKIRRKNWNDIYRNILDYMDSENKVTERELMVLGVDKDETSLYTNEGTFKSNGIKVEELKTYHFFVSNKKILGMVEEKEKKGILSNVYLKSFENQKAEVLFDGREYSFATENSKAKMKNVICDLVFQNQKICEVRKKEEMITGNLITMDKKEIEIEGYGKIPLADRTPAYQVYGTFEEKSLDDIVLGNMNVQYVVGEGKVQAVLLKEPANIENIRVLLLNGTSCYYEEIYLTADKDFTSKKGKKKKKHKKGEILSASGLVGDSDQSCVIKSKTGGKLYLTKEDGSYLTLGYSGNFEIRKMDEGYTVVNEVSFEDYICGVLPSEMPEKFDSEALKAQAICARSYAYMRLMKSSYAAFGAHVDDSTNYQVYNKNEIGEKGRKAVEDTIGLVLKYKGNVAEAYYHSTSCGHTGTMEDWNQKSGTTYGYLKGIWVKEKQEKLDLSTEENFQNYISESDPDCYDGDTPYFRWKASLDFNGKDEAIRTILMGAKKSNGKSVIFYTNKKKDKKSTLKGFGAVTGVKVEKRGASGAIRTLRIDFENGMAFVKNEYNIRKVLGAALTEIVCQDGSKKNNMTILPSAYCTLHYDSSLKKATASGGGLGHGIGMSQYGADGMARAGHTYDEILKFFYSDIQIEGIY
ncbi:MAG: SpoIID/LytB domain-containing protein [Lachnospiraceae bacterium]|nr:SpoIID/LytB domain-containing protein [Lachnospiraceae bacterium]